MSMVDPSIDYLATLVDSKYTLAILTAKRTRESAAGKRSKYCVKRNRLAQNHLYPKKISRTAV